MTITVSSLSVALQGIADFIDAQFGEDVLITIDSPLRAHERAKSAGDKHVLNLFFYRVAPSGFHADAGANDRFFIRVNALLTAFPNDADDEEDDADLRVLGHAMRVLASKPVIPTVLPGAAGAAADDFRKGDTAPYRLQAILQAPSMEELNHIWTTQGGELGYRLSAAYEFALIPIEPLELAEPAPPMRTGLVDLGPDSSPDRDILTTYGEDAVAHPLSGENAGEASPAGWLPVQMFAANGALSSAATVTPGTGSIQIALAGPPDVRTALTVNWIREDGTEESQSGQVFDIQAQNLDDADGRISLTLVDATDGDTATIVAAPLDSGDTPIPGAPPANELSLKVEAAP